MGWGIDGGGLPLLRARLVGTTALTVLAPPLAAAPSGSGEEQQQVAALSTQHANARVAQSTRHARQRFSFGPQPLTLALKRFSEQTGIQVAYSRSELVGQMTDGVSGMYIPEAALRELLKSSGMHYRFTYDDAVLVQLAQATQTDADLGTIVVQGEGETTTTGPVSAEEGRFGDPPPEPGGLKAEFQTTATKTALPVMDTPQAITVITGESIEARQATDLESAVELVAGVIDGGARLPGPFAGQTEKSSDSTGLLIRGQEANGDRDIRSDGFSAGTLNAIDLAAYERIDVVKGPSGFYGQGSLGGFVNLVRKKPKKEFEASGTVQGGSFDTYRGVVDVTGALTEDGRLRGRLTGAYEDAGSFVDGVETDRAMIAPSLEARIGDRTRALVQLLYQEEEFLPNPGIPVFLTDNRLTPPNIPRSLFVGTPNDQESTSETFDARLRVDHELSDRWLASLLLQKGTAKRRTDLENYAYYLFPGGGTTLNHSRSFPDEDRWAGEVRLDGKIDLFNREHQVLVGVEKNQRDIRRRFGYVYLGYANIYDRNFEVPNVDDVPFNFTNSEATIENTAVYGQAILSLTERTKLLAGVRRDWADQENFSFLSGSLNEKQNQASTVRLGLVQELTDTVNAYATYGQSFSPVTDQSRTGEVLEPETGDGYEAGIKTEWFDKKLGATVSVYRQELENIPILDPSNGPGESFSVSAGLHRTDGIEVEVVGSLFPGLTVAAGAAWTDNEFIDPRDPNFGLKIDGSVDRQFSLYAHYELQSGPFQGLGFGATLISLSDRNFIRNGTQIFAEGYERVDLNLSYKGEPDWDMSLLVRNIFDENYLEQTGSNPNSRHFLVAPRTFLFRVTKQFHAGAN
ncbi:MAG: TonB-dependent receptor [Hyphomicrobiaceae bacterium]|nr:TonB-dependent receptor [Hyphomicrobiaceae bacterium]